MSALLAVLPASKRAFFFFPILVLTLALLALVALHFLRGYQHLLASVHLQGHGLCLAFLLQTLLLQQLPLLLGVPEPFANVFDLGEAISAQINNTLRRHAQRALSSQPAFIPS